MFVTAAKATGARTNFVFCAEKLYTNLHTRSKTTLHNAITLLLFNEKHFALIFIVCSAEQFIYLPEKILINTYKQTLNVQKWELKR